MAITATSVVNNPTYKSWTFVASDADTTGSIAHGFGAAPDTVILSPTYTSIAGGGATPMWSYSVTATTLTLTKTSAVSSGGTTTGTTVVLKVVAMLPNSAMQG